MDAYYHAIDFRDAEQVQRLLRVYEAVLDSVGKWSQERLSDLLRFLERDGFVYQDHRILPKGGRMSLEGLELLAETFDASYVRMQVARIEASVDPRALAVNVGSG